MEKIFSLLFNLNKKYKLVYEKQLNSILYMNDKSKGRIRHVEFRANKDFSFEILFRKTRSGYKASIYLILRKHDFTMPTQSLPHRYFYKSLCNKSYDLEIFAKEINDYIEKEYKGMTSRWTLSSELSQIIGKRPMPKYIVLHRVSNYLLSNRLVLRRNDVSVSGKLKLLFEKSCILVNEDQMFATLKENILTRYD